MTTPSAVPAPIPAPSVTTLSRPFSWMTCIHSQAAQRHGPITVPEFSGGHMAVLPQQYYEPTIGNDEALDRTLEAWGVLRDGTPSHVFLDLEYRFGIVTTRPVMESDYLDPRQSAEFRQQQISAVARVKTLRPKCKVGIYESSMKAGLGEYRNDAEFQSQLARRREQQNLNNNMGDVFKEVDFVVVSMYRRNESVGGDPMNYDVRDTEIVKEIGRIRNRCGSKAELWAMVSPFVGRTQTGVSVPIRPEAVYGPGGIAARAGWEGACWWGNAANDAELSWLNTAIDRVRFAARYSMTKTRS